eukprot:9688949-Prorocentrum_lima.AAC.1
MQVCCEAPWGGPAAGLRRRGEVPRQVMDKSSRGNPQWTWPLCSLKWQEWPIGWHHADPLPGTVVG